MDGVHCVSVTRAAVCVCVIALLCSEGALWHAPKCDCMSMRAVAHVVVYILCLYRYCTVEVLSVFEFTVSTHGVACGSLI